MPKGLKAPFYGKRHTKEARQKMSEAKKEKLFSKEHRQKIRKANRGKCLFGFTGTIYKNKNQNPWTRVWKAYISYNKKVRTLGQFEDPLSCEIIHDLILEEIIDVEQKLQNMSEEEKLRQKYSRKPLKIEQTIVRKGRPPKKTKVGNRYTRDHFENIRKAKRGNGLFGFTGAVYKFKNRDPSMKVWQAYIRYNKRRTSLGYFNDPLSCQIVYDLVLKELQYCSNLPSFNDRWRKNSNSIYTKNTKILV